MTLSVWRDFSRGSAEVSADVAVIGAGVAGLAVARQCLRRGLVPAVIDARDLAAGATGRNAGFAMTGLADPYSALADRHGREVARQLWAISQANLREIVDDIADAEGVACELVPCGSVVGAWSERERDELARSHAMLVEDGFDARWLDRAQTREKLGSDRYYGGIFVPQDHGIHPVKLAHALADRARAAGARLLLGREVQRIEQDASGVAVLTSHGAVRARRAVLCTNAYTSGIERSLGSLVRPVRGQALCIEGADDALKALLYTDDGFQYARPLPDGRVVAGGWRRAFAETEVGLGDECTDGVQDGIERWLRESWPQWSAARVTHRWSGTMGFSPDGIPLVGTLPGRPSVGYAVGFTGHGLGFAFAAARAVMALLFGEGDGGLFANRIAVGA